MTTRDVDSVKKINPLESTPYARFFTLRNVLVLAFFLALLASGLLFFRDYGLTWDDLAQIEIGELNFKYVFHGDPSLLTLKNRYYGPLFEMFLYAVTNRMPDRMLFFTRHLLTFASFYVGMIYFYKLAKKITCGWQYGLAACLLLATTPILFGHAFFNSKDIPFLAAFIVAAYSLVFTLEKPVWQNIVLHAVASAVLISLRAPGILIFGLTLGLFAFHWIFQPGEAKHRRWFVLILIYTAVTAGLVILFWPILWHDPVGEFVNAMQQMSKFPWEGGTVLYRGQFVDSKALPWHYIPVWMLITIPLPYLALAAVGGLAEGLRCILRGGKTLTTERRNFFILAGWLLVPLLTVIILHSVLYDGWRQMFFIYPPLVILAILGLKALFSIRISLIPQRWLQGCLFLLCAIFMIEPVVFIVHNHPFEHVYFNRLGGADMARVKRHYELDYWGLSYKQGLEYLLKNDPSETVKVYVFNRPGKINALILPEADRRRLVYMDKPEDAAYFLTNYRWHPQPYDYTDEIYTIKIGNASIFSVFRLKP